MYELASCIELQMYNPQKGDNNDNLTQSLTILPVTQSPW